MRDLVPRRWLGRATLALVVTVGLFAAFEVAYERTDTFRRGNRLYHREGRATPFGIAFARFWTSLSRFGLTPSFIVSLETIGVRSGMRRAVPMVIAAYQGRDHLVSMLGE